MITKVLESQKYMHPYAPSPLAGKQYSASGKLKHRRHVWKTTYGKGISRVPRKIMSRRGTQFNWEGATAPNTKGGIRAHPPKIEHFMRVKKINKKELKLAFISALSATTNPKLISKKYFSLSEKDAENAPFIVESGISRLKSGELIGSVKKILGDNLFSVALIKKMKRAGRGKSRGRNYKQNAGLLIVTGNDENIKTGAFEIAKAKDLRINDLTRGGAGRLVIYTENALRDIESKLNHEVKQEHKEMKKIR